MLIKSKLNKCKMGILVENVFENFFVEYVCIWDRVICMIDDNDYLLIYFSGEIFCCVWNDVGCYIDF